MELTEGAGVDVAIEAVGLSATFAIWQDIVAAGGRIATRRRPWQTGGAAYGKTLGS
jgi:hypothetical protein